MKSENRPDKYNALEVTPRTKSIYPEPFATMMNGRAKRALGDLFGITKYGVNLTVLKPGGRSSLLHRHSKSEEFIYVLSGKITLVTPTKEIELSPGECAGFIPSGEAHMLMNNGDEEAHYLEVGDREPGDSTEYPHDDIVAKKDQHGKWVFFHKDETPY